METLSEGSLQVKTLETSQVSVEDILFANHLLKDVITHTPLQRDPVLSSKYDCNVYLKREDLQVVRSFKIRGAYNVIRHLPSETLERGVICASAGNHAQGVAFSCQNLQIPGRIFMPNTTPKQKVSQVKRFGGSFVEVVLTGDTFDDSLAEALKTSEKAGCNLFTLLKIRKRLLDKELWLWKS